MENIIVHALPQTAPISAMRTRESELVEPDVKPHMVESAHSDDNIDALAAIVALAQPMGPSDLSLKFDTYTAQVFDDEFTSGLEL